jgi:hypothetical protein
VEPVEDVGTVPPTAERPGTTAEIPTIEILDTGAMTVELESQDSEASDTRTGVDAEDKLEETPTVPLEVAEPPSSETLALGDFAFTTEVPRPEAVGDLTPIVDEENTTDFEVEKTMRQLATDPFDADDMPFAFQDEAIEGEDMALSTEEFGLTSLDMASLEEVQEAPLPGHLTLELDPSELTTELAAPTLEEDALLFGDDDAEAGVSVRAGEMPEAEDAAFTTEELGLTSLDMASLEETPEPSLPGHLTLDLDPSELTEEDAAHQPAPDDEDELLLDLDDLDLGDDEDEKKS